MSLSQKVTWNEGINKIKLTGWQLLKIFMEREHCFKAIELGKYALYEFLENKEMNMRIFIYW
jgi:hypothetical protein